MGTLFVNKSGRAFKITRTNGGSDVIGTLPVNAIFAWTDSWAGNSAGADYQGIYCNGMYGWIDGATGTGAFTPLTECGLYNVDVDGDGTVEAVFQTRRAAKYYDKTGKYLGTVPKGYFVATSSNTSGKSHPNLMYVERWGEEDPSNGPMFMDTGMDRYPNFRDCNIIGNI